MIHVTTPPGKSFPGSFASNEDILAKDSFRKWKSFLKVLPRKLESGQLSGSFSAWER
jgi:hypothetical protein